MGNRSLEAEIVVIGGGGAGLAAALAAAEKSADVLVLEKRHALGGNSVMAEGLLAADSPAQKRMRIEARRDDVFRLAMEYAHWKLDGRIVRAFIDKSGDTIRWLEEKGLFIDWIPDFFPGQRIRTWHCLRKRGAELINLLLKECKGQGVRIEKDCPAKKLLIDEKGSMTGVLATRADEELHITAKGVIIATGGYGGNEELLRKTNPFYNDNIVLKGVPHAGDGILMALEVGAASEGLGLLQFSGHTPHNASDELMVVSDEPNTVWVNKRGARFTDEAIGFNRFESANAVLRQPDSLCYTLFDDRIKQDMIEHGVIKGVGCIIFPTTKLRELGTALEAAASNGNAKISDSWEGIADWMEADPEVLKETIEEYNKHCDQGHDDIFAKDNRYLNALRTPPFYALKCYPRFLGTIGGIRINHHMEVLDREHNPVPGLYAAGVDTGGWEVDTYNAVLSGSTFGFAINSGRISGENATAYVKAV